jgi:L-asparaginase/Glu-tRNA(Gln) amidotransferase subunit D
LATLTAAVLAGLPPALVAQQASAVKPRVHVIATGGTISNMGNDPRRTGAELAAYEVQLASRAVGRPHVETRY